MKEVQLQFTRSRMFSHERTDGRDEWLTPPEIVSALGAFDLDPCSPINRPWPTARHHFTIEDDGLSRDWFGRVWMNPPYGTALGNWMARLAEHNNGIALIFARTETQAFFESVWGKAASILFLRGRLKFRYVTGEAAPSPAGAPSVLIAYGQSNSIALKNCGLDGHFLDLSTTEQAGNTNRRGGA